jgi:hypothetical protein
MGKGIRGGEPSKGREPKGGLIELTAEHGIGVVDRVVELAYLGQGLGAKVEIVHQIDEPLRLAPMQIEVNYEAMVKP